MYKNFHCSFIHSTPKLEHPSIQSCLETQSIMFCECRVYGSAEDAGEAAFRTVLPGDVGGACPTWRDAVCTVICHLCQRPPAAMSPWSTWPTPPSEGGAALVFILCWCHWIDCFVSYTLQMCMHTPVYTCPTHAHMCASSLIFFFVFLPSLTLHHQLMSMIILLLKRNCSVKTCVQAPLLCTVLCMKHCDSSFLSFLSSLFLLNFWTFSNTYHFFTMEDHWRYTYYLSFYLNKV